MRTAELFPPNFAEAFPFGAYFGSECRIQARVVTPPQGETWIDHLPGLRIHLAPERKIEMRGASFTISYKTLRVLIEGYYPSIMPGSHRLVTRGVRLANGALLDYGLIGGAIIGTAISGSEIVEEDVDIHYDILNVSRPSLAPMTQLIVERRSV
jgi:hypothetical protein